MLLPAMTTELARRIEQNDLDYSMSRLAGMQRVAGNPLQIEIKQFGPATAFLIRAWPDFWYGNKVLGLNPEGDDQLDEIVGFFGLYNLSFRFEILPGNLNRALAARLHRLGYCQMGFSAALYGQPQAIRPTLSGGHVSVRGIRADEVDLFVDLYQYGFGLPHLNENERRTVGSWLGQAQPDLHLCIAHVDDHPAGIGILFLRDGIGLLADATTLPDFRGQGCHAAMIEHRITEAAKRDCDLITSFVEFGAGSHRNLGKAGLRVAYTKALWWSVAKL
jgi:GNAT superfamily N-acetyltransferase